MSRLSSPFQRMLPKRLEGTAGKTGIPTAGEVSCVGRLVGGSLEGRAAAAGALAGPTDPPSHSATACGSVHLQVRLPTFT